MLALHRTCCAETDFVVTLTPPAHHMGIARTNEMYEFLFLPFLRVPLWSWNSEFPRVSQCLSLKCNLNRTYYLTSSAFAIKVHVGRSLGIT
ncbi:unnamed protein product [Allacma fusca]|uniref:Uncharacterized protein n=1 Tax=Allacma fusca TaxID=39272 RepID=A0A8J2KXI3_9HEXA|nr:unnamed protein product [Allacma fusca]